MRIARPADRSFAMSMVPGLVASSPARWRNPRKAGRAYATTIEATLAAARPHSTLLVGECDHEAPFGLALLSAASNCYTHERQGHLVQAAVAEAWQSLFDAIVLIKAARAWANSHGYVVLMPDEFWIAHPATALCRRHESHTGGREPAATLSTETGR